MPNYVTHSSVTDGGIIDTLKLANGPIALVALPMRRPVDAANFSSES